MSFKSSPNYEDAKDVGGDNIYNVTISRSGGSLDVAVNVTNVDEMGSVTLDDLQPQAGAAVSVTSLSDPDGDTGETTWQWSKSMDEAAWEDISGATSSTYTPKTGDIGYYLQATAEYSDGLGTGRDSASAVTEFAVERRPAANSRPAFADADDEIDGNQQERTVKETAKVGSSVGNAVTATDADNDPLLYGLDKVTAYRHISDTTTDPDTVTIYDEVILDLGVDGTLGGENDVGGDGDLGTDDDVINEDTTVDVTDLFTIDSKTGQISVKGVSDTLQYLNIDMYETIVTLSGDGTTEPSETAPTADAAADRKALAYDVTVTATDPSGSTATVTVTIKVAEQNEAPAITRSADDSLQNTVDRDPGNQFVVTTPEQVRLDLGDITGQTDFSALPVFNGYDVDSDEKDIVWSLSGVDAKRFDIANIGLSGTSGDDTTPDAVDHDGDTDTPLVIVSRAALRWSTSDGRGPSFEAMDSADGDNVYLVTVTASDGSASKSQAVSITVTNREEGGKISLSQLVPQEGIAITARLSDQDGNITGTEWQWYRGAGALGVNAAGNVVIVALDTAATGVPTARLTPSGAVAFEVTGDHDNDADTPVQEYTVVRAPDAEDTAVTSVTLVTHCDPTAEDIAAGGPDGDFGTVADNNEASSTCAINGATSSTYIPTADDANEKLQARATYLDAFKTDIGLSTSATAATTAGDGDDDGDAASKASRNNAETRPNENALPDFGEDESVSRSVAENVKGASVGDPVTAIDDDVLKYSLSGDGSDDFEVAGDQITTAKKLDFETRSSYTLTLTATDPSLASSSIVVNITVNDTDDSATIVPASENNAPAFASESVTVSVDENAEAGTPVGDPIVATDKDGNEISYSLDDDSIVEIWPSGQLTVAEGANLDYESGSTYTVILTASDGIGGSSIEVTVNVNNVGLDNGYDTDDNGEISKDEAIAAVDDYFLDNITRDEVNGILALYFG